MARTQKITPVGDRQTKPRKLFRVILVAVLLGIAAGIWVGIQAANQGSLSLTTSAKGLTEQNGSIKVRISAVDALQLDHKLYTLDQTATVKDGQLKIRWQPPDSAKKRATYIEVCALDSNISSNTSSSASVKKACLDNKTEVAYNRVSCPYYVAPNSTGFSGQLAGWNRLNDSQKVGCAEDKPTFGQTSGITALTGIQSQSLPLDGSGVLVSENGELTTKDINQLVTDALTSQSTASQTSAFTYLTTSGASGTNGANGVAGLAGATGPAGPSGVATCPNGNCLSLQAVSPGVQETGNVNVSGTILANAFSGSGANLTNVDAATLGGNAGVYYTNATNISSGTLADARLSANVALLNGTGPQTFTGNNKFTGTFLDQNATNSTSAFTVQNALGDQLLNADTFTTSNIITNPSFEPGTTGWAMRGSPTTFARDTTQHYSGNASLKIATRAVANDGAKYPVSLASSSTYTFSFYAKLDSGSGAFPSMVFGRAEDGATETNCLASQTVVTTGWTRYSCTFTTDTTVPSSYIYIKNSFATVRTFYIDGAQLELISSPSSVVTNGDFETDLTGWIGFDEVGNLGPPTLTRDTSQFHTGAASMQVITNDDSCGGACFPEKSGAAYQYNFLPNTQYTITAYVKLDVASIPTSYALGRIVDVGGSLVTSGCQAAAANISSWKQISCTFTTDNLSRPTGTGYIVFFQASNLGMTETVYVDTVTLYASKPNTFSIGQLALDGAITSPAVFQNSSNSLSAFQIQDSTGTSKLFTADTVNNRIGIGTNAPAYKLDVSGDINLNNGAFKINGTNICTTSGCTPTAAGVIANSTALQSTANFNIQSVGDAAITGVLRSRASQTADALQIQNSSGVKLSGIGPDGSLTGSNVYPGGWDFGSFGAGADNTDTIHTVGTFSNNDIIKLTNNISGTIFYTRVVAGGGTSTLTVSPRVNIDAGGYHMYRMTAQNIGATTSDYTTAANRFYQGSFLSNVTIDSGNGNTTLSNGLLYSTNRLNINAGEADGATAVGLVYSSPSYTTAGAKLVSFQNNTVEKFSINKDGDIVTYGHIKSTQTTAPTIGTPANCGATPTASVAAGSTDSAGSITINAGTGGPTTCDSVVSFNRAYGTAPKSVILTPASAISAAKIIYVGAINTTDFTVGMATAPAASESNTYYYWVVE